MITVHYHRFDNDYEDVSLWTWDQADERHPDEQELFPDGFDEFGPRFHLDPGLYGAGGGAKAIGLVPRLRRSWEYKDGGDRIWTPPLGGEIWILSGDPNVYRDRPDVAPRVEYAWLREQKVVTARLSHGMTLGELVPGAFEIKSPHGDVYTVEAVRALDPDDGRAHLIELILADKPVENGELLLLVEGYRPSAIERRRANGDLDKRYRGVSFGAICSPEKTVFRVYSPTAHGVHVVLYDNPSGPGGRMRLQLESRGDGVWEHELEGDHHGRHYMLYVEAVGASANREVVDVYTRCATGRGGRGKIVDPHRLDPTGFRPLHRPQTIRRPTDAIIYEMHVRDFTIHESSGVPAEKRGKYLGVAEAGTRLPGADVYTGIDHLKELGVTHVQLLPVQDFEREKDKYNWGYMTVNFFSPEGWYASDPESDSRVREMKALVKALHDAGIRVVMDVVYNHTGHSSAFESIAPGYYHRLREDGTFWNGSGTGNEFRSEAPMARKFIVDCCRYWMDEYGVDGFRFDLMGLIDLDTMKAVRDELQYHNPTILVYGEPWAAVSPEDAGIGHPTSKEAIAGTGIGGFNDHFRNALKGDPEGSGKGYIQGGSDRDSIKPGIEGAIHDWSAEPSEAIQYADCHDNLCLYDKIKETCPNASRASRIKIQALALGILAISQGVMFVHGGSEFARTKKGHPNTYDQPDEYNQFDWTRKKAYHELFVYTREMIALRREHAVFRLGSRVEIEKRLAFHDGLCPTNRSIALTIDGLGLEDEEWTTALVLINPHGKDREFKLPEGTWDVYTQGMIASRKKLFSAREKVIVPAHGLTVAAKQVAKPAG